MAVWSMDDACALYLGHIFNGRNLPARVLEPAIVPILGVAVQLILIDVIVGSQGRRITRRPRVWWHAHAEAKNTRAGGERRDDLADLAPPKDGGIRVHAVHDEVKNIVQGRRLVNETVFRKLPLDQDVVQLHLVVGP